MVAKINYNEVKLMKPEEAFHHINSIQKGQVKDMRMYDIVNMDSLNKAVHDFCFIDLSPRGVYMFFDQDGHARYIGQTNQSFYQRLPTQLDTWFYSGFGWNSMLRIMGGVRLNKPHNQLTEEDHEVDLAEILNYHILLIEVDRCKEIESNQLLWIEKILLKTYKRFDGNRLLNGNVGGLYSNQWQMAINNLIR